MTETDTDHVRGERFHNHSSFPVINSAKHIQEAGWYICHILFVAADTLCIAVDVRMITVFVVLIL